jgi:hypothetical protein
MLRRFSLLLCGLWAAVFLLNGATKAGWIGRGDLLLAVAPLAIGLLLREFAHFVVSGIPRRSRPFLVKR